METIEFVSSFLCGGVHGLDFLFDFLERIIYSLILTDQVV